MYIKVIWYYLFGCFGLVGDAICAVCSVVGGLVVVVGSSFKYKETMCELYVGSGLFCSTHTRVCVCVCV